MGKQCGSNHSPDRRHFIGGSDARIIMGNDEEPPGRRTRRPCCGCGGKSAARSSPRTCRAISSSSLGSSTEDLNRRWYEANTGQVIIDIQRRVHHPALRWMAATLGWPGRGQRCGVRGQVHAAVVVLGRSGGRRNTCRSCSTICGWSAARTAVLSIITGGGKWVEIMAHADPLYQHLIVTAERKFWRCVENGEPPQLFGVDPPKPRIEAIRIVDMSELQCLGGVRRHLCPHPIGPSRA